ncbi:glycosyltransferase family 39 protein [Sphingobacterium oryzagri]|uniref:Glycosyltransferase family 39 protein n=1 Tax=Sphingobacterium oryzagri TaxID=3025669 RepID=A0ABY7WJS3_9SPHI|nr:glycosyltransferase family 39 protein [Sphingobacterium sp. KACC 22765]WDF69755.1 glycosyltransferase family 39 protein [Sphingobacterium sp. KACC 22765]
MCTNDFKAKINWLIILMTSIRCICACLVELGNDEVYYYTYAAQLDWNHFDHPPLVGVLIRFFTLNLHGVNDFSMRLGAIVSAAAATWLIAQIGMLIKNERTGFIAAILYNASIYTGIIAGLFILPDSPAVLFWLASIYTFLNLLREPDQSKQNWLFTLTGLWIGLATMSKVHGCFLWLGILGYIVFCKKTLLRSKGLYIGFMITAIVIMPIFIWNIQHDFITYRFHGDRVAWQGFEINLQTFAVALIGQFMYANPLVALLAAGMIWAYCHKETFLDRTTTHFLLWLSVPIIGLTTIISLFKPVLPHWSGPGLLAIMLLTASWVDERLAISAKMSKGRSMINSMLYLNIVVMLLAVALVRYYPGTLGKKDEKHAGEGDFTLDMYGWRNFAEKFQQVQAKTGKLPLLVDKWFIGGHLYYYVARPLNMPVVSYGSLHDLHKFAWLMEKGDCLMPGSSAYYVAASNYYKDPRALYPDLFEEITLLAKIPETRSGKVTRYWYIYKLERAKTTLGTSVWY